MALHSPARFDAWLSEIRWGIDKRYILTTGYFGFEPKGSLSTPSTKVQCRSAVDGLTGSSGNLSRLHLLMAPTGSGSGLFIPFTHCRAGSSNFSAATETGMKNESGFVMTTGFFGTFR